MPHTALSRLVDVIKTKRAGERDLYPDLKTLLTSARFGVGLAGDQVVVDSPSVGGLIAPDLTIFLSGNDGGALRGPDHAFAVMEAKPGHALARPAGRRRILREKADYVQTGTRYFYLIDQERVLRYDVPVEAAAPAEWEWDALKEPEALQACFGAIGPEATRLEAVIAAFRRDGAPHAMLRAAGDEERRRFIDTIRTCLQVTSQAVRGAVQRIVVRDLGEANEAVGRVAASWGEARYRPGRNPFPMTFAREQVRGAGQLRPDELRAFLADETQLATDLDDKVYALRVEHDLMPFYAQRLGLDVADPDKRPSLLKPYGTAQKPTPSGRAVETFAYETATLMVSRMLMIRFSEDNGFIRKMISNGGVEAFHAFDAYSSVGFQMLLSTSYARAKPVYSGLFSDTPLDWILQVADDRVDGALAHALWMLNRWDFGSVDGDVLSGVYDKYLDPARRRALGEVFTRPEVARYLLDRATEGNPQATVLDPACGSGTFVVERLAPHVARLRADNLLAVDTIKPWLERTSGLDVNPFSATLARMQVLWHLLDAVRHLPEDRRPAALRSLVAAIRVAGGHTSLDTFGVGGANRQGVLDLTFADEGGATRTSASALFRTIATDEYDAVVGNPPFVRAQRLAMPDAIRDAYADVLRGEADLYVAFVKRALETWVRPGGRLAFVLPLPSAVAGYARPMRELVETHKIVEIVDFEPMRKVMFRGVKRPVLALVVQRTAPTPDDVITLRVLDPECYDAARDLVDMSRATSTEIARDDFVTLYAPIDLGDDDEADEEEVPGEMA